MVLCTAASFSLTSFLSHLRTRFRKNLTNLCLSKYVNTRDCSLKRCNFLRSRGNGRMNTQQRLDKALIYQKNKENELNPLMMMKRSSLPIYNSWMQRCYETTKNINSKID